VITKSLGGVRRPRLNEYSHPRKQEGKQIGKVVAGFREQRQAMRADAGDCGQQYIKRRGYKRVTQDFSASGPVGMAVAAHAGTYFKFNSGKAIIRISEEAM